MKKVLIGISLLIFLFGAFLFIYVKSLDPGELRRMLLHEVEKRIHGQCSIEELEIGGFGSVYAKGLKISTIEGSRIIEVDQLRFSMNLSDLINSKLRFTTLKIYGLKVFAEKVADKWNFNQIGFQANGSSKNRRRLSIVADVPSKSKAAFQIDSFISTDAWLYLQGQAVGNIAMAGRVIDDQVNFDTLQVLGPGKTKLETQLLIDLAKNESELNVVKGSLDIDTINTILKTIDIKDLPSQLSGEVQLTGLLNWKNSKFVPDIKFLSKQISGIHEVSLTNFQGFWNGSQFKGLTNLNSFTNGVLKWSIKPYDGHWVWPNIYTAEFILDNITTPKAVEQKIKSEAALVFSSQVINVQTFKLISEQGDDSKNLITAKGAFSLASHSGKLKLISRELPLSLLLPEHRGRIHGEAQLVLAKHFGMDYEVYGKIQDHSSQQFQFGNVNFHVAGQVDKETFEFSKYSFDVGKQGTIRGAGLFRFKDPIGSLASISYLEKLPISSFMTKSNILPSAYVGKAKLNFRNQQLTLQASNVKFSDGLIDLDLRADISTDLERVLKSSKGKISLRGVTMPRIEGLLAKEVSQLPITLSGTIHPGSHFDLRVRSKESKKTKLSFKGQLDNSIPTILSDINMTGKLDLLDLASVNWFADRGLSGEVDMKGSFVNEQFHLSGRSKSIFIHPKGLANKLNLSKISSEIFMDRSGQFKLKQADFSVFDGSVSVIGSGNFNDMMSSKAELVIRGLDVESLLAHLYPAFQNHFKGKFNANVTDLRLLDVSNSAYPIKIMGDFNLNNPVYVYHESVVKALDDLQQDLTKGWLKQIIQRKKMDWENKATRQSEFRDTAPQSFSFSEGRLKLDGLKLSEKRGRFSTKLIKPLEFILPNEFRKDGHLSTELKLTASNQFIKDEISFLRDAYDQDLSLSLILDGPPASPISENQFMTLRQKLASEIGSNLDPKKIQLAAKLAAKKAAKKVKQQLIKKSDNIVEKTLKSSLSKGAKRLLQKVVKSSDSSKATTPATSLNSIKGDLDEVEQKVKKKLRSFLQDLF